MVHAEYSHLPYNSRGRRGRVRLDFRQSPGASALCLISDRTEDSQQQEGPDWAGLCELLGSYRAEYFRPNLSRRIERNVK